MEKITFPKKTFFSILIILALFTGTTAQVNEGLNENLLELLQRQRLEHTDLSGGLLFKTGDPVPAVAASETAQKADAILRKLVQRQAFAQKSNRSVLSGLTEDHQHQLPFAVSIREDEVWVEVIIKAEPGYADVLRSTTAAIDVNDLGGIVTASIPLSSAEDILAHPMVSFVETGALRQTHNYSGKNSIHADKVHRGENLPRPYLGDGVVVGVVDSGIDFTHPDFSDENGTRIQHLVEYTVNGMQEWTKQQIDSNPQIVTQRDLDDGMGHGTHVTGTAAGGGRLNPALTGMAPKSDIIFVKGYIDGSFSDNNVINGCNYIFTMASAMGKPAVINLSLGGLFGPLDGTSLYEQALSNMTGPGRIIVATTGNEGFSFRHAGANLQASNRYATLLLPNNESFAAASMWHRPGVVSQVAMGAFSVNASGNLEFIGSTQFVPSGFAMENIPFIVNGVLYGYVSMDARTTADPRNGDGNILVAVEGADQVDIRNVLWLLIYDTASAGRFDMWSLQGEFFGGNAGITGANELPGDVLQTTGAPSTARKVVSVGSFVSTNSWTDIDNQPRQWLNPDPTRQSDNPVVPTIGQMSYFSSIGPTRDGRIAPDISGPGELIFSAMSSTLTQGVGFERNMVLQGGGYQGMQGTSMAAPHVSGLVALMLEINPELDYDDVVGILRETARSDGFTGSLPNQKAGYGKVDAYAAILKTLELTGVDPGPGPSDGLRYFDPEADWSYHVMDRRLPIDSGFVFGTNRFFDMSKATAFTLPDNASGGTITGVDVWFGYRSDGLTNETYSIDIYNGNASTGPVGAPIASQSWPLANINSNNQFNFTPANVTRHTFQQPVEVGPDFFVSVNFGSYNAAGIGRAGIVAATSANRRVPEVWEQWNNGSWHNLSDAWTGQNSAPGTGTNGWYMWKEVAIQTSVSVTDEIAGLPDRITLDQNYPNPFNPETQIRYALHESAEVTLTVYDMLGRKVAVLDSGFREAGFHTVTFQADGLGSGVYIYRLAAGPHYEIRKMTLLK